MPYFAALPFYLSRSEDVIAQKEITTTSEIVHGLLRLDGDRLVFQWRVARKTDRIGRDVRTDHEIGPVEEVVVPLSGIAGARLRSSWWSKRYRLRLVLTAADLRAFEQVAGEHALRQAHPAELTLRIRRTDRQAALEFANELELAVANRAIEAAEATRSFPPSAE